ncbi:MAG: hypothetical protein U0T74_12975 [Chitinophagales bacterium]
MVFQETELLSCIWMCRISTCLKHRNRQPTFSPVYDTDGVTPLANTTDPSRFQYKYLATSRAVPLPTLGVVITY